MLKEGSFLGSDTINSDPVDKYIEWHKNVRKQVGCNTVDQNEVLYLNFEDFFLYYDETIEKIKFFLDINFSHKDKGSRFNPEYIKDHVGIWRGILDQDAALQIEKELGEYCYSNI